jgi:hypothetical protein
MPFDKRLDSEQARSDFGRHVYMCVRAILSVPPEQWVAVFKGFDPDKPVEPCKLPPDQLPPAFRRTLSMPSMAFGGVFGYQNELHKVQARNAANVVTWLDAWAFPDDMKMPPQLKCFLAAWFATYMLVFPSNATEVADSECQRFLLSSSYNPLVTTLSNASSPSLCHQRKN